LSNFEQPQARRIAPSPLIFEFAISRTSGCEANDSVQLIEPVVQVTVYKEEEKLWRMA